MKARTWQVGIAAVFLVSLGLPAWHDGNSTYRGCFCLMMVPYVMFFPAWWANPLLLAGCLCLLRGKPRLAGWLGVLALILAASFAMTRQPYFRLQAGYYAWVASLFGLIAAAIDGWQQGRLVHEGSPASGPEDGSSSSSSSSSPPLSSPSPS